MVTGTTARRHSTDELPARTADGAVERALSVLCCFSRQTPTLGVTDISERLNLTKSTVHRLLQALVAQGLVTQDAARRQYSLGYRVLAQDDDRARQSAVDVLEILLGTLLRPLHRKTRMAAFGALANAARADQTAAARVLRRAREALRLPDTRYPKEQLIGLIGAILHAWPALRGPRERPVVFGLQESPG